MPARTLLSLALTLLMTACEATMPEPPTLCDVMAARCGGEFPDNWRTWCRSSCVPEYAQTTPCDLNDSCILCDAPRTDGNTIYFGLPTTELEYMWTLTDDVREPNHPPTEVAPTGTAFVDHATDFPQDAEGVVGAWHAYDPFPGLHPYAPEGFCEPGPNRYIADDVVGTAGAMLLSAQRMPTTAMPPYDPPFCSDGRCVGGPYESCDAAPSGCQYREDPDVQGLGTSSQADRFDAAGNTITYGYGEFRSTFKAAGDTVEPEPGFVYAFFTQGNEACIGDMPNIETNSSEIDIEVSSGEGEAGGQPFCTPDQMCLQVSTWVSSTQGIADYAGVLRHQVSGFRFRDRNTSAQYRTYGFDWQPTNVRFVYDRDPHDCDEQAGGCSVASGSLAICEHLRFVPRRPAPLHFQLWNAWWAGSVDRGTQAQMSVERVWYTPAP